MKIIISFTVRFWSYPIYISVKMKAQGREVTCSSSESLSRSDSIVEVRLG